MDSKSSFLTLGWQVTNEWEPKYWMNENAIPGGQSESDLVRIPAELIAEHTAIIAQSGSGKSFFLGRLIEEILLNTKARCIVFDPNADFRKVNIVENATLWRNARYDVKKKKGRLPHESSKEIFERQWKNIKIGIRTALPSRSMGYERLKLNWRTISSEFLTEDLDPIKRSGVYYCHLFTRILGNLVDYKDNPDIDLLKEAEELLNKGASDLELALNKNYKPADLVKQFTPKDSYLERIYQDRIERQHDQLKTAKNYVDSESIKYYFGKAREFLASRIITFDPIRPSHLSRDDQRLQVIDLPSLKDYHIKLLAVSSILAEEWEHAHQKWNIAMEKNFLDDSRVPTFIIVDEAHNLIPSDPHYKSEGKIIEQFRTIIAEGRKYGVFLILVTQRPDKMDPKVLSECNNRAIMKLSSEQVLETSKKLLNLDSVSPKFLEKTLDFSIGRGILIGGWTQGNYQPFFSAARRTVESGRNLRDDYWSKPYENAKPKKARKK